MCACYDAVMVLPMSQENRAVVFLSVFALVSLCTYGEALNPARITLQGPLGETLDRMIDRQVAAVDPVYFARCFHERTEKWGWQSEFWGKYMHAAPFFAAYRRNQTMMDRIAESVRSVMSAQAADGYIGNYSDDDRCRECWDVWGLKYTMLGLLNWYDATGDAAVLASCQRLCDFVLKTFLTDVKRELWTTGNLAGLPSCSILEPVVLLYGRTHDDRYLEFARDIVRQMREPEGGPRLFDLAEKGVPVADRSPGPYNGKTNRCKAYEMMSCCQGLLEYWQVTHDDSCYKAVLSNAESILADEINLAGSGSAGEFWFHGALRQSEVWTRLQETCVTVTWMRLAAKLLAVTGDSRWGDAFERTFYNAYLASLKKDGSIFAAYTPLNGDRSAGNCHCRMHTNCCNANGPRGYLAFLRTLLVSDGQGGAVMNLYASSRSDVAVKGGVAHFETHTTYPRSDEVSVVYRTKEHLSFPLRLRIPAWSSNTVVCLNEKPISAVRPGEYLCLSRTWTEGDRIELVFDQTVRIHRIGEDVAFTRGPVLLARDSRFVDGDVDEPFRADVLTISPATFHLTRSEWPDEMRMTVSASLPVGLHEENPDGRQSTDVHFCDYASAANLWRPTNRCRTWFPLVHKFGGIDY